MEKRKFATIRPDGYNTLFEADRLSLLNGNRRLLFPKLDGLKSPNGAAYREIPFGIPRLFGSETRIAVAASTDGQADAFAYLCPHCPGEQNGVWHQGLPQDILGPSERVLWICQSCGRLIGNAKLRDNPHLIIAKVVKPKEIEVWGSHD